MKLANTKIWVIILLIGALCILPACGGGGGDDDDGGGTSNQVSLELEETTTVGSATVGANGSLLFINTPDDPLDGLEIDIPVGAYQEETGFTVSYSPIISHSGNENLNPVTPLISIENGGEYADEIISVKIPVTIEDGYHYMAFYYDETTDRLEGIPELEHDEKSLTIATRHFSKIMVNRIDIAKAFIYGAFGSDYQVTKDNWQFKNPGTYLSPGGICSGMSVASLYYYLEKKKKLGEPQLFGHYDNGVAGFGLDDEQAIKLCSTAQWYEENYQSLSYAYWYNLGKQKSAKWTYFMFCHAILLTGEPQYVSIFPPDDSAGHALVVYKKSGNDLYVADPNLPNDKNVKIEFEWDDSEIFTDGHFKPFESQWNTGTDKINFTEIFYSGQTAVVEWKDLNELWQKIDNQTVGKNFPDYDLKIIEKDATGTERESILTEGYKTTSSVVQVKIETYEFDPRLTAFYAASTVTNNETEIVEINLNEGKNEIGFYVEAEMYSDVTKKKEWAWTDFKYVTIEREKENAQTEASISVTNTLDIDVTVLINGEYPGGNAGNGYLEPSETLHQIYEPGTYQILIKSAQALSGGPLEYTRQINLGTGEAYVYDFGNSQDCNVAKVTISNQTSKSVTLYRDGSLWYVGGGDPHLDAGKVRVTYLPTGTTLSLSARAPTWEGLCFSNCIYACWSAPALILDCQGTTWTISGSGSTCP